MSSVNGLSFLLTSRASELETFRLNYEFQKADDFIQANNCPAEWRVLFGLEMKLVEMSLERDELYVHRELLIPEKYFHFRQVAVHSSYHPKAIAGKTPSQSDHPESSFSACTPETCDSNKISEFLVWPSLQSQKKDKGVLENLVKELGEDQTMLDSKDKLFHMHRKLTLGRVYMELDEMEKAMEVFEKDLKIFDIISSQNTTPEKTYTYLKSSIPRICGALLSHCVFYLKNDQIDKAVTTAKQSIEYLRVLLDSNNLALIEIFIWSQVMLAMAIAILLEYKKELLTCTVGMRLFLMITVSLKSWGKLRILDEYATLLENRHRICDYHHNFVDDRTKIGVSLTLGVRESPENLAEDLLLCDFLGYIYFGDSVAKTKDEVNDLMTRVNKTTFRLARSGFFRNLSSLYRNLFRHRVGTASLYRRLFLSLVSANFFDEAILAYEQYNKMMNRSDRKAKIDPFVCLVASKCYLIHHKNYEEAIKAATIAVDLSNMGLCGDTNARGHHYLGLAFAEKARHECEADVIKNLRALSLDELNRARHLDPNNDSLLYDLAFIYSESREIPLAIKTVRASLRLSGGQMCKWHLLALLHSTKRNYDAALEVCDYLLKEGKNLKSINVLLTKSMILCELGKFQEASELCLAIFAIWNHFLVKVKFRDDIEVVNASNEADKFEAMKGPPGNAGIDGNVLFSDWLEMFPQPIQKFNETFIKTSVSKRRNSRITTGYQWFNSSDLHAMSSFGIYLSETMGLSRADFLGHVWIHLSKLYVMLNSPNDAKEAILQALSMNEISATFNAHAGHLYSKLEDWDSALRYYFKAIAIDPECCEAFLGLGYMYMQQQDYNLASYYFREVLARDPFSYDAWLYVGKLECMDECNKHKQNTIPSSNSSTKSALEKLFFARTLSQTLPVRPFCCCPASIG